MHFFEKLERKYSRLAIPNLMLYLMILYAGGLAVYYISGSYEFYYTYLSLDMAMILKGQVWRLITFLMLPPSTGLLYCALMFYLYYSISRSLERLWGTFYFNLYIFIGILAQILAAALVYLIFRQRFLLTADNLYLSLLLAIALTIPETQFLLFWFIPVKAKYLAWFYGAYLLWQLVTGSWYTRVEILASFANFLLFFLVIKRPVSRVRQVRRRVEFEKRAAAAEKARQQRPRHVCAVCGRSSDSNPELEFRYCSKCAGGKEYCMEHLYSHIHVTEEELQSK